MLENLRAERVLMEEDLSDYKIMQIKRLGLAAGWSAEKASAMAMQIYEQRLLQSRGRSAD